MVSKKGKSGCSAGISTNCVRQAFREIALNIFSISKVSKMRVVVSGVAMYCSSCA